MRYRHPLILPAILIGLAGCDFAESQAGDAAAKEEQDVQPANPAPLIDSVILPVSDIPAILEQCSRLTPAVGEAGYLPDVEEIVALETALPEAVSSVMGTRREDQRQTLGTPPRGWRAQYVGLIRDGRRYVYGNFFPDSMFADSGWRETPVIVCDGGPDFFGAEFDVQAGRITHLGFNGMA